MVKAICQEITLQKDYLEDKNIDSIYFGGGTPSLLSQNELEAIFSSISAHFSIRSDAEITLEANPDDLSKEKLKILKANGVNRLSIGIQSFFDSDLEWMNRSHNTLQSHKCLDDARQAGFDALSIDLIFGSPSTAMSQWEKNLELAIDYQIPHLSCYGLTVEENTALDHFIKKGKTKAPDDEIGLKQFEYAMSFLTANSYDHYEISNYCLPGLEAVHNSNYWRGKAYLGLGPSAHSFNGKSRQWNISHNIKYLKSLEEGQIPFISETLSAKDIFNEYLLTGLRTKWGCDLQKLKSIFPQGFETFEGTMRQLIEEKLILIDANVIKLTQKAKPVADSIIASMFATD